MNALMYVYIYTDKYYSLDIFDITKVTDMIITIVI